MTALLPTDGPAPSLSASFATTASNRASASAATLVDIETLIDRVPHEGEIRGEPW